jgi:hypothetical protein
LRWQRTQRRKRRRNEAVFYRMNSTRHGQVFGAFFYV